MHLLTTDTPTLVGLRLETLPHDFLDKVLAALYSISTICVPLVTPELLLISLKGLFCPRRTSVTTVGQFGENGVPTTQQHSL